MRAPLVFLPLLAACASAPPPEAASRGKDYFINTTAPYAVADGSCWTVGSAYVTDSPLPEYVTTQTLNGKVQDFQTEESVYNASVDFWFGDDISAASDLQPSVDPNTGAFTAEVPVCQPIGYRTSDPYGDTVPTYEVHQVWGYQADGTLDETVNSVSEATASLIPAIIGIDWDRTTGIIAGTVYDCNEKGVENAQVWFHNVDDDAPPAVGEIFYFDSNDLPAPQDVESDTNTNGLWVAVNVPVGTWTVEAEGWNGTSYDLLGGTTLTIEEGSVNISNIHIGHGDGVAYPSECLEEQVVVEDPEAVTVSGTLGGAALDASFLASQCTLGSATESATATCTDGDVTVSLVFPTAVGSSTECSESASVTVSRASDATGFSCPEETPAAFALDVSAADEGAYDGTFSLSNDDGTTSVAGTFAFGGE
jgi:hypothetical protein